MSYAIDPKLQQLTAAEQALLRETFEAAGSCGCDGAIDDGCPACNHEKRRAWLLRIRSAHHSESCVERIRVNFSGVVQLEDKVVPVIRGDIVEKRNGIFFINGNQVKTKEEK